MRLHIIGPGVVGKATGEGFRRFGHEIIYTDKGEDHNIEADIHFICTPEEVASDVAASLLRMKGETVVIRSSVAPGTTAQLKKRFPSESICHNPEFLREATAESDFLYTDRTIVGIPNFHASLERHLLSPLSSLHRQMGTRVYYCHSTVSEMVKLLTNCYLATQISFWNEAMSLCNGLYINSHEVAKLVALDSRVSKYGAYQHGLPYSGRCLPKDLNQVLKLQGIDSMYSLLNAVQRVNIYMGGL